MLVSPYLSPESRAICTDHDVAYLDLVGNARLAFDTVYIEHAVADKPRSETRALHSIFDQQRLVGDDVEHSQSERRFHALGVTASGRRLHVTFTLRAEGTLIRVIAARDMHR